MNSKKIAMFGIFSALIFVAFNLDKLLSLWLPVSAAVITLTVVLTFCFIIKKPLLIISFWTLFGIASFITAFYIPSASAPLFMQPQISILPRFLVGILCVGITMLVNKFMTKFNKPKINIAIISVLSIMCNTLLTLTAFVLFGGKDFLELFIGFITGINFVLEVILVPIILPFIFTGVNKSLRGIELWS